jgi:hypothetical protein
MRSTHSPKDFLEPLEHNIIRRRAKSTDMECNGTRAAYSIDNIMLSDDLI